MSEEQQKPEKQAPAAEPAESAQPADKADKPAATSPDKAKEKSPAKRSGGHLWALLLILVVLAGMAALIYRYAIQHKDLSGALKDVEQTIMPSTTEHPAPAPAPATPPSTHAPEAMAGGNVAAPEPVSPPRPLIPPMGARLSSPEAKQLMSAMEQLQQQLQQLRTENEQIHAALIQQQRLDLNSRLKLIADPDTRLKQLSLLWEDVSLSPALSAAQRNEAISMTAAAHAAETQNQLWQQRLDHWITQLAAPEAGPDLIPHFDHPWLEWLAEQFHLRPAPTNSDSGSQVLREKLIQIRRNMDSESWPDAKQWQPIRAELILINASSAKDEAGKTDGLGLPNDFTAIRQAVAALHETARKWLEAKP